MLFARLFAELLNLPAVAAQDSFFALGGDSILSIQLVSRARQAGLSITPRQVFEHQTPAALAAAAQPVPEHGQVPAESGVGAVPLTPIMRWLLDRGGPVAGFSQARLVHTPPDAERDRLTAVLGALLDHHDALRATLDRRADALLVGPPGCVDPATVLTAVAAAGFDQAALERAITEHSRAAVADLAPERGRVLRAVWFDRGRGRGRPGRLLLVAHHLVVDAVSWRVLLDDLDRAWSHPARPLAPVGTSLRQWALALRARADDPALVGELDHWTATLAGPATALADRDLDPAVDTAATVGHHVVELPEAVTQQLLTTTPAAFHAGVLDVLLTGLALAVTDWQRGRGRPTTGGVLVALEGHGREEHVLPGADLTRTVGWFTSLFPVRLDLTGIDLGQAVAGGPAAGAALKRVKEQLRALPGNGVGYGLLRHLNPTTGPRLAEHAEPQIGFNYLGRVRLGQDQGDRFTPAAEAGLLAPGTDPALPAPRVVDVNAVTVDGPDGPRLRATWSRAGLLLAEPDLRALAEGWVRALTALTEHTTGGNAGGHTPSDVALLDLDQDEIDEFEAEWRTA